MILHILTLTAGLASTPQQAQNYPWIRDWSTECACGEKIKEIEKQLERIIGGGRNGVNGAPGLPVAPGRVGPEIIIPPLVGVPDWRDAFDALNRRINESQQAWLAALARLNNKVDGNHEQVLGEIERLREDMELLRREMMQMQEDIGNLRISIETLRREFNNGLNYLETLFTTKMDELKNRINQLMGNIENLVEQIRTMTQENREANARPEKDWQDQMRRLREEMNRLRQDMERWKREIQAEYRRDMEDWRNLWLNDMLRFTESIFRQMENIEANVDERIHAIWEELQKTKNDLLNQILNLMNRVTNNEHDIRNLRTELKALKEKLERLENRIGNIRDGRDGRDGKDGRDGRNGVNGGRGPQGIAGKDGEIDPKALEALKKEMGDIKKAIEGINKKIEKKDQSAGEDKIDDEESQLLESSSSHSHDSKSSHSSLKTLYPLDVTQCKDPTRLWTRKEYDWGGEGYSAEKTPRLRDWQRHYNQMCYGLWFKNHVMDINNTKNKNITLKDNKGKEIKLINSDKVTVFSDQEPLKFVNPDPSKPNVFKYYSEFINLTTTRESEWNTHGGKVKEISNILKTEHKSANNGFANSKENIEILWKNHKEKTQEVKKLPSFSPLSAIEAGLWNQKAGQGGEGAKEALETE